MPLTTTLPPGRVRLGRAALVVAVLCAAWSAWLVFVDGFEAQLLGVRIKSNEPLRALTATALALVLYALAHGLKPTLERWTRWIAALDTRRLAMCLAVATSGLGVYYATTAAIGPDNYGYVSEADLWLRGDLTTPQPWTRAVPWPLPEWTFTPVAYQPSVASGGEAPSGIVPIYSPGLPLLMAALKKLGGQEALFWVVPIAGGLLVLATYAIGCQLASGAVGLMGAWLLATSPAFLFVLMQPMSDVPAAACWAAAMAFMLRSTTRSASAAGLASALAILIRPNLAPLAAVLALWPLMLMRASSKSSSANRSSAVKALAAFAVTTAIGPLMVAIVNAHLYGSPLSTGYGNLGTRFAWAHVIPNLKNYLGWLIGSQTPIAIAGLVAIALPVTKLWPRATDRRVFLVVAAFMILLWAQYLAFEEFDAWWFLRYLLPGWPFIMLGVAAVAAGAARSLQPAWTIVIAWLIFMLGGNGVQIAQARGTFNEWRNDRRYIDMSMRVRDATEESSVIYTSYQSGSMRYYGSRQTLRFDFLAEDWLDRSIAWFTERGVHPYALFANRSELADFRKRFAGQRAVERLDESLAFTYTDQDYVYFYFYDLLSDDTLRGRVEVSSDLTRLRSVPPVPMPTLVLTP